MNNKIALIGYSGFIGSNLLNFSNNLIKFNSKNINKIKNQKFNLVICTGTSSKMWLANKKPLEDKRKIKNLTDNLKLIKAEKFVLISTCEIYGNKKNCIESNNKIQSTNTNYGLNRYLLEKFIEKKFKNHFILRLPIVYGKNFKKNCIYDLINNNEVHKLNGSDLIQIYNVKNLKNHIKYVIKNNIKQLNISSKPIKLGFISKKFFNIKLINKIKYRKINLKSIHGNYKGYFLSQSKTLKDLNSFLKKKNS